MTNKEIIENICEKSGISENVVRRVMAAERDCLVNALKKGERANLIGRAIMYPSLYRKLTLNGEIVDYVKVKVKPSKTIEKALMGCSKFEDDSTEDINNEDLLNVLTTQIDSLI